MVEQSAPAKDTQTVPRFLSADLLEIMTHDEPGRHEIAARFDGHLLRDDVPWMDAHLSGAVWDLHWTGRGEVLVR